MLARFHTFLSWLSRQSISRFFSYTRQLERQLNNIDSVYREQIRVIREENHSEMDFLKKEITDLKAERQALLDRLLARNGYAPIWHKQEQQERPKTEAYKPAFEAAIEDAEVEHRSFKSMLETAKEWARQNEKAE